MLRIREEVLPYHHSDGRVTSYRSQIFQQPEQSPHFVFSDVPHNEGPKVKDCTEGIARDLREKFSFEPDQLNFYERRPDGRYDHPKFELIEGQLYKRDKGEQAEILTDAQVRERVTRGLLYSPGEQKLDKGLSNEEWIKASAAPANAPIEEVMSYQKEVDEKKIKQGY